MEPESDLPSAPSIYDIARAAGVNPSTVSRALNNRDRIGAETRRRILRIARELGYQPNVLARSLSTNRTNTVGVVAPVLTDSFMSEVVEGIELAASENAFTVLFSSSRRDPQREIDVAVGFQRHRVDAVIIVSSHLRSAYERFIANVSVPVVVVGQVEQGLTVSNVVVDDERALRELAQRLVSEGHRRFAYVGVDDRPYSSAFRGEALARHIAGACPAAEFSFLRMAGSDDIDRGSRALAEIDAATALLCYNDLVAIGALWAAQSAGRRVPEDISVVGYDDIEFARRLPRPLTTIHQPRREMGMAAIGIVRDLYDGHGARRMTLGAELVPGSTVGPVAP